MTPSLSAPGTFYPLWQLPEHYLLLALDYTILDASDLYLAVTFKQRADIGEHQKCGAVTVNHLLA